MNRPVCPTCLEPCVRGDIGGRMAWCCIRHGVVETAQSEPPAGTYKPRKRTLAERMIDQHEDDVVADIGRAITMRGGQFLLVGQKDLRGSGTTEGTPDMFVWVPGMVDRTWIGLEVKALGGKARPKQEELERRRRIWIVDSVSTAMGAIDQTLNEIKGGSSEND